MARPLRVEVADGVYHVTSRGLERRAIVRDDIDRARWVELLSRVADKRRWRVFAWALMGNHFHLFLRTPDADLSAGMHDLNSGYVTGFNRRHNRVGPLFQGRFKAVLVERGYHYWELSRYVHLNPVRAGVVAQPDAYAWSSCSAYFQARGAPEWLAWEEVLGEYGRTMRTARRAYRQFLDAGLSPELRSPLREATAGMLLGSPRFIERTRAWLAKRLPDREVPAARAAFSANRRGGGEGSLRGIQRVARVPRLPGRAPQRRAVRGCVRVPPVDHRVVGRDRGPVRRRGPVRCGPDRAPPGHSPTPRPPLGPDVAPGRERADKK